MRHVAFDVDAAFYPCAISRSRHCDCRRPLAEVGSEGNLLRATENLLHVADGWTNDDSTPTIPDAGLTVRSGDQGPHNDALRTRGYHGRGCAFLNRLVPLAS